VDPVRPGQVTGVLALGSEGHRALIGHVIARYRTDPRVLAIAVFGSVSTGDWHPLSDVDLDVVVDDAVLVSPAAEVTAIFGSKAAIVVARADSADVVLDSLEEVSIRWHPLRVTSPNISSSARVVAGLLTTADIVAAAEANRRRPDEQLLLDTLVREAIGAWKFLRRGRAWDAVAAIQRMRQSLTTLRGRRDDLRLDPADPAEALATVITEARASFDFGPRRADLLDQIGLA